MKKLLLILLLLGVAGCASMEGSLTYCFGACLHIKGVKEAHGVTQEVIREVKPTQEK